MASLLTGLYFRDEAALGGKQMAVFNSATVILKALEDIFVDLVDNNGLEWKLFLTELNAQKQLSSDAKVIERGLQIVTGREGKEAIKNELAEIEILMNKLAVSKNRRERRRLLAMYNQH